MKRDWDTVRYVLISVAESEYINFSTEDSLSHVELLIQAKLLSGTPIQTFGQVGGYDNLTLTWMGHDFLDLARDTARWQEAMAIVEEKHGISFDMLMGLLKSLAQRG